MPKYDLTVAPCGIIFSRKISLTDLCVHVVKLKTLHTFSRLYVSLEPFYLFHPRFITLCLFNLIVPFDDTLHKKVSDYCQEIPQSQTVDNLWHREEEPHTKETNKAKQPALSSPSR